MNTEPEYDKELIDDREEEYFEVTKEECKESFDENIHLDASDTVIRKCIKVRTFKIKDEYVGPKSTRNNGHYW